MITVTFTDLSNLQIGDGTVWCWDGDLDGLGVKVRNSDLPLTGRDGAAPGRDLADVRTLRFPLVCGPPQVDSIDDVWGEWETLDGLWQPSTTEVEAAFTIGTSTFSHYGYPDASTPRFDQLTSGDPIIRVLLAFRCPDPTRY